MFFIALGIAAIIIIIIFIVIFIIVAPFNLLLEYDHDILANIYIFIVFSFIVATPIYLIMVGSEEAVENTQQCIVYESEE